jgi:CHAT domain
MGLSGQQRKKHPPKETNQLQKILILTANPKCTTPLRLDEEVREIDAGLQRAKYREEFILEQKWAVRPRDIQRVMLDFNPTIVHFSGHGAGSEGLVFEDETGQAKLVDGEALAGLFSLFEEQVECVLLNGCYSEVQADAIAQHINYVIGMNKAIGDRAAIEFAVGFYDALGAGKPVKLAYKFGCAAIRLAGIREELTPTLKEKPNIEKTLSIEEQPPVTNKPVPEELNDSDREILTELLIRSGRAEYSARKALCIRIGIESSQLGFLTQSTDADFALQLISHLHSTDDKQALGKICKEIQVVFKRGKYAADLESIKSKLTTEL